jgi:cyclopropane fatty-acyl-phospholipid synthase-like methyltransferase
MSDERQNDEKTAIFQKSWGIYEAILDRDYMFHKALFAEVRQFLMKRFTEPFTMADLGCGSARHIALALTGLPVKLYRGIDLAPPALKHAEENLRAAQIPAEFIQEDLFTWTVRDKTPHDFLFSAFAVHHLNFEQKRKFFLGARQSMAPRGAFLLIDVMREGDETRPIYLDRYCNWIRTEWSAFSAEELDMIVEHVRENDFPETVDVFQRMAIDSGFAPGRELCRYGWHRAWLFEGS